MFTKVSTLVEFKFQVPTPDTESVFIKVQVTKRHGAADEMHSQLIVLTPQGTKGVTAGKTAEGRFQNNNHTITIYYCY